MEKSTIIILCLFLWGCNHRSASCVKYNGDDEINIHIEALNDDIESIEVSEIFVLSYELLADNEEFARFKKQLDSSYHLEENRLIRSYAIVLDDRYSFMNTLKRLQKERYHCE
ncbi:MAG: hypothetical protein J6S49_09555 [Erysipelotrichaceae bacterium]|nr:hypothetical protein [Erysipelotrichaceae bacterium]